MMKYDVVVVGGGPGGYVAAIRSATNGYKTALIEGWHLGGTCLNRGCIPSKTLLHFSEIIEELDKVKNYGIKAENVTISIKDIIARKNQVVTTLRNGIKHLLNKGKIDVFEGYGTVHPNKMITIKKKDGTEQISAEKIIIATGSEPMVPPIHGIENVNYFTTDNIFDIDEIPSSLVIVGGGVIGVELANIFSSFQTKVTIVELMGRLIPTEDEDASKLIANSLKKKGVKVITNYQVSEVKESNGVKEIRITSKEGKEEVLSADALLIAVGRKPNLSATNELNLQMDGRFIKVDEYLETSVKDIFAIGDVLGGYQLAHVASAEGLTAVENLYEKKTKMDYKVIPRCIYTNPQVASVGLTETELKEKKMNYKAHTFSLVGNGKAMSMGATEGFTKIMIDDKYGEILGVVMAGPNVTEMISQSSAFMYLEGTVDELARIVQPHPTVSEAVMEAANALIGKGIHV